MGFVDGVVSFSRLLLFFLKESPWRLLLENDHYLPETGMDKDSLSCEGKRTVNVYVFKHISFSFEFI